MVTYLSTGLPGLLPPHLLRPEPPNIRPPRPRTGTRTPTAPTAAAGQLILQPIEITIPRPPPPPPLAQRTGWWGCVLRALRWLRHVHGGPRDDVVQLWRWVAEREEEERGPIRLECWRVLQVGSLWG